MPHTRLKTNKTGRLLFLLVSFLLISACASTDPDSIRSRSAMGGTTVRNALLTAELLQDIGILSSSRTAPVTTGEKAYGTLVDLDGTSLAALFGVSTDVANGGFTPAEIEASAEKLVDLATSLLTETLGADVTFFSPEALAASGLGDAQAVHNTVIANLLGSLDAYLRVYVKIVDGPQVERNIRMDIFMWLPGDLGDLSDLGDLEAILKTPGQYVAGIEVEKDVFDALISLNP